LRGEETSSGLKNQIDTATKLIRHLQSEIIERGGESLGMAAEILEDDVMHATRPSLDAEYVLERQLATLLNQRIADTELAEQYKLTAQTQAQHFNKVIVELNENLMKEHQVKEEQDIDAERMRLLAAEARERLDKLKVELDHAEEKRMIVLREERVQFEEKNRRIQSEFEAATEFCRDLRRKLQAEQENIKRLVELGDASAHEVEALQITNTANTTKLQDLSTELQKTRHDIARLNQIRQKESEESKQEITKLREQVLIVEDKITIIEERGAKIKAVQLEKINKEREEVLREYEEKMRHLKEENEAEVAKNLSEYEIQVTQIDELKQKDTADVEKEQKKAAGDLKKLENTLAHELQRIQAKILQVQNETSSSARLAMIIRDQIASEKSTRMGLEGRLAGVRSELSVLEEKKAGLQQQLKQFERDLSKEKDHSAKQLEAARQSMKSSYSNQRRVLTTTYENEIKKIEEELKIQTRLANEARKRYEDTSRNLEDRQRSLEGEMKEVQQRKKAADEKLRKAEAALTEVQDNLAQLNKQEATQSSLLDEQRSKNRTLSSQLAVQQERTSIASNKDRDTVRGLEVEKNSQYIFIDEIRRGITEEEEKTKKMREEKRRGEELAAAQLEELKREIEEVKRQAREDREKGIELEKQVQREMKENRLLKDDIVEAQETREKSFSEKKEVHNVEVSVVQRN